MNKKLILFILGLILLTALFLRVRSSLLVLSVNGEMLKWEDFNSVKLGYSRFRDLNKSNVSDEDIEKGIMFSFVEDVLIKKELEKSGRGREIIDKMVEGSIRDADQEKISDATSRLYGWTLGEFKKIVLEPQARRNLIDEEFRVKNIDFTSWLEKSMLEADVSVYFLRWKWSGSEFIRRF